MGIFRVFKSRGKNIGVKGKGKNGKEVTLLNPYGKSRKYASELKNKKHYTNNGQVKTDEKGRALSLTKTQSAYRSGYLQARKDSAACYNATKTKKRATR